MGVTCSRHLDKLRDKAVQELKDHCLRKATSGERNNNSRLSGEDDSSEGKPSSPAAPASSEGIAEGLRRFSDLLLRLSPLRSLQPDVLEELFFPGLIGKVNIDSVVPYILKMKAVDYGTSPFSANNPGKSLRFYQNLS